MVWLVVLYIFELWSEKNRTIHENNGFACKTKRGLLSTVDFSGIFYNCKLFISWWQLYFLSVYDLTRPISSNIDFYVYLCYLYYCFKWNVHVKMRIMICELEYHADSNMIFNMFMLLVTISWILSFSYFFFTKFQILSTAVNHNNIKYDSRPYYYTNYSLS